MSVSATSEYMQRVYTSCKHEIILHIGHNRSGYRVRRTDDGPGRAVAHSLERGQPRN